MKIAAPRTIFDDGRKAGQQKKEKRIHRYPNLNKVQKSIKRDFRAY